MDEVTIHIALVEDSETDQLIFSSILEALFPHAQIAVFNDAMSFLSSLSQQAFDCLLLDFNLPDDTGLELLQDVRRMEAYQFTPIIMLTGLGSETTAAKAIKYGASDYLPKREASEAALKAAIEGAFEESRNRQRRNDQQANLRLQASTDSLTGLLNRAEFDRHMQSLTQTPPQRQSDGFALLYLDLNKFKAVNDTYGHAAGDLVLSQIATRMRQCLRASDLVFRLGGDEFGAILRPAPAREDLMALGMNLSKHLAEPVLNAEGKSIYAGGGSIGIAEFPRCGRNAHSMSNAADKAMYQAKSEQMRVVIA